MLLVGCRANQLVTHYDANAPVLSLDFFAENIVVEDLRNSIDSSAMKLPVMSVPNQYVKHTPALTGEHITVVQREVSRHFVGEGQSVVIQVVIEDAYKEFLASWSNETERGCAAVSVTLVNPDDSSPIAWCSSTGEFSITSVDATHKRTEQIYQIALKKAISQCLEHMQQELTESRF